MGIGATNHSHELLELLLGEDNLHSDHSFLCALAIPIPLRWSQLSSINSWSFLITQLSIHLFCTWNYQLWTVASVGSLRAIYIGGGKWAKFICGSCIWLKKLLVFTWAWILAKNILFVGIDDLFDFIIVASWPSFSLEADTNMISIFVYEHVRGVPICRLYARIHCLRSRVILNSCELYKERSWYNCIAVQLLKIVSW